MSEGTLIYGLTNPMPPLGSSSRSGGSSGRVPNHGPPTTTTTTTTTATTTTTTTTTITTTTTTTTTTTARSGAVLLSLFSLSFVCPFVRRFDYPSAYNHLLVALVIWTWSDGLVVPRLAKSSRAFADVLPFVTARFCLHFFLGSGGEGRGARSSEQKAKANLARCREVEFGTATRRTRSATD